ncbi:hypothetical protein [Marinilabilia sp.]
MVRRLFLFNPTNEMAISNGQVSYMPPAQLKQFEKDLAALPWLMADENDFILVPEEKKGCLSHLTEYGLPLPRLISKPEDIQNEGIDNLWFEPWGWSPAVYRFLNPFLKFAHSKWSEHPFSNWKNHHKHLLSRDTGYQLLEVITKIKSQSPNDYDLIHLPDAPMVVDQEKDLDLVLKHMAPPSVVKTPFSAAGRGLFRIRTKEDDPAQSPWVKGMLKRQGKIYIEKMLPKIQDVSFQFWLSENSIRYCGHNFFYADPSGQFAGCAIGPPDDKSRLFKEDAILNKALKQASILLETGLKQMNLNQKYIGPAGIDGIFFRNFDGRTLLQPCLEINLRHNMGMVNIFFKKKLHPKAIGIWKTGLFRQNEWMKFCREKSEKAPLKVSDGQISHGFLPFVAPDNSNKFGAWLMLE